MMLNTTILAFIWLFAGILWWIFFFLYRNYRVDLLRHRLFVIRNNLFLAASRGEIDFNHPAYVMTRKTLNGTIRFAHQLSLTQLLLTRLFIGNDMNVIRTDYENRRADAYKDLTNRQIKLLSGGELSMHVAMISHVVHISPALFPGALLLKLAIKTRQTTDLAARGQKTLTTVDAFTYKYGDAAAA